ncbi:MAG: periplasmic heavy metal sensor [Chlorobiaceae bacterium]|nr:periplasmic heavy metal sensor [Chlorobiaceae bacterium]
MSITMKKKMIMTVLVAGFISTAGTVFAKGTALDVQQVPPDAAGAMNVPDYGMRPEFRHPQRDMKKILALNDAQVTKITGLRRDFFSQSKPVRQTIGNLRHELALESVKPQPDKQKIAGLTRRIGEEHIRLADLESRHLQQLATVLDSKQIERFLQIKERSHSRHGKRG